MLERLFDKKDKRNIPTKDLYLILTQLCYKKEDKTIYFNNNTFILARKVKENASNIFYQDIFTETLYQADKYFRYSVGKVYVRAELPIVSNLKFISFNEATMILEKTNNVYYEKSNNNIEEYDLGFFSDNNSFQFSKKYKN